MQEHIGVRILLVIVAAVSLGYGCNGNGCGQDKPTYDGNDIQCGGCERIAVVCEGTPIRVECVSSVQEALPQFNCTPAQTRDCRPGGGGSGGAS
ncbi:MAG: hypothetical protein ACRBN8_24190 [Nannocystales bacterium]